MKINPLCLIIISIAIISNSCEGEKAPALKLSNPIDIQRDAEVVTIAYNDLTAIIGEFPEGMLPLFIDKEDTLVSQFIGLSGNLIPEEILLEVTLAPGGSKNIIVKFIPEAHYPVFKPKTNIRFARKSDISQELSHDIRLQTLINTETAAVFQMEGPAWENDKLGFRNYFDLRNGMDIFGKTTSEMVLDGVGLGDNYHSLADWGMDILKVGNSLGAGAIGVSRNGRLFRIGDNGEGKFKRIYEGTLRNEFRFDFPAWSMENEEFHVSHYITTTAGQYAYKSSLFVNNLPDEARVISGIVNILSDQLHTLREDKYECLFTHDKQAEDQAWLAMALLIPTKYYDGYGEASNSGPGIIQTYYGKMKPVNNSETEFYFYSLWETSDKQFSEINNIREFLRTEAAKLSNPILVGRIN